MGDPHVMPRGCRSLWSRAWLHEAVAAIDINVGHTVAAPFHRTRTGVPFPWCRRSVALGRITRVEVRVDIGLCIRPPHAGDHLPKAQATHQELPPHFLPWTKQGPNGATPCAM